MTHFPRRLLARVSAPAVEPLTLTETKLYLRIDQTTEDTLVANLITAARMIAENYLNRSIISQSWMVGFNRLAPRETLLPMGPVNSLTSVTLYDEENNATAADSTSYFLDESRDAVIFLRPAISCRVEIVYATGYGADSTFVPEPIRQGMLAHISSMYEKRGDGETPVPPETIALYAPYREVRV